MQEPRFGIERVSATFLGKRRSHRTSSTEILLASMRRITVVTGIPEPVERLASPLLREMVTTE